MDLTALIASAQAELASTQSNEPAATDAVVAEESPTAETVDEAVTATEDAETDETSDQDDAETPDEEEGEDQEDDDEVGPPTLSEDQTVVIDGKEVLVKDALMMRADYTRKTQELATLRQEVETTYNDMRAWYEERESDPVGWVGEIAQSSGNPTALLASAIVSLNEAGLLDQEFVQTFGLDKPTGVSAAAQRAAENERLARLEAEAEARRLSEQEQAARRAQYDEYEAQLASIVQNEALDFATPQELAQFRVDLLTYAAEHGITDDLRVAYKALAFERSKQDKSKSEKAQAATVKKRATKVVSKNTATNASVPAPARAAGDTDTAIRQAQAELAAKYAS